MSDKVSAVLLFTAFLLGGVFVYKQFFYKDPNSLWVGISPDYKPLAYKDRNEFKGFDVDLCLELGERLHKKIIFKEGAFSSLIMSVKSGYLDFAISGITPTEDREMHVDFSDSYLTDSFCIVTKDHEINSLADLRNDKNVKIVGVQSGSVIEDFANRWRFKHNFKIVSYNLNTPIVQALSSGHLDAMFVSTIAGSDIVAANKGLRIVPLETKFKETYAIAFPKNSPLKDQVNKILKELNSSTDVEDDAETETQQSFFAKLKNKYNFV